MKLAALLIWGLSFALMFLPVAVWQGLPMISLLVAVSFPHFVATYVIWVTKVSDWRAEWASLVFVPVFLGLCWLAESASSGHVRSIPYQLTYWYLTYHFARQLYGAALWGGLNLGLAPTRRLKLWLQIWFLAVPGCALYSLYARRPPRSLFFHEVSPWSLPQSSLPYLYALLGVILLGVLVALGQHYQAHRQKGILWPVVMLGLPLIWFLPPFQSAEWVPIIPLLHALQYAPFWSRLLWDARTPWFLKLAQYAGFVVVGWLLFRWFPLQLAALSGSAVVYGAWVAMLNAHHFWIDGRIWHLRDPRNSELLSAGRSSTSALQSG